ncbi:hypothetical protein ES703_73184 [subsurface metagenome]
MKDTRVFNYFQHTLCFGSIPAQRLGAKDWLLRFRCQYCGLFVEEVRQADHYHVRLGIVNGFSHVTCRSRDIPFFSESAGFLVIVRVYINNTVAATLAMKRHGVEHADKACSQHGNVVGFMHDTILLFL